MTTSDLSRRSFAALLLAGLATPLQAGAPGTSLRPKARPGSAAAAAKPAAPAEVPGPESLLADSRLTGVSSFALARLGKPGFLESVEPDRPLPPASVGKCLTAFYALETLGPDYRFVTRVIGTGPLANGILGGDLILVGGGDPGLDTDALADLAGQLKAAGVREVRGRFLYHGSSLPEARLIDAEQPYHVGYNPGVSALNLNYNRVNFEWKKEAGKWQVTLDARTANYRPEVGIATMRIVDRAAPIYTYDDREGRDEWTVAQSALGDGGTRWLPVRRPAAYAAEVFAILARANGIVLKTPEQARDLPAGTELARVESPPLHEVAKLMLHYSNNLTAELLGLTATAKRLGQPPASIPASARAMSDWAHQTRGLTGVAMVDHSGLGDASVFPTGDLVRLLAAPEVHDRLRPLLKEVTLLDDKGRIVKAPGFSADAKTGTLNFVSGLAGYITARNGSEMVFAVLSGDVPRRDALTRDQRERPDGGRAWTARARHLQQALLNRWGTLYEVS